MDFLGVAGLGPSFLRDAANRVDIERSQLAGVFRQHPAKAHGAGPALLDRGVVEIRIRLAAHHFVRHWRRFRGIHGVQANFAVLDATQNLG